MGVALAGAIWLAGAAPAAAAAGSHVPFVAGGILGSIFGSIGHAVLGAFSWTIGLASKFILTTIGALVRMLIPRSWANEGVEIMEWIVAVPNYAGTVTSPDRPHDRTGSRGSTRCATCSRGSASGCCRSRCCTARRERCSESAGMSPCRSLACWRSLRCWSPIRTGGRRRRR